MIVSPQLEAVFNTMMEFEVWQVQVLGQLTMMTEHIQLQ